MNQNQKVVDYYNKTQLEYNVVLSLRKHLGMHFGYFEKGIKNIPQAVLNMNRILAKKAEVKPGMRVLDAGCGIGGTAIWLAKNTGCQAVGIALVKHQIDRASMLAERNKVEKLTKFFVRDFTKTKFDPNSFDAVLAVESIGHSGDVAGFLKEALRILKPKGKIVVCVYYSKKRPLNGDEKRLMDTVRKGWILTNLLTKEEYIKLLRKCGFASINFDDVKDNILPYSKWLYYSCRKWAIPAQIGYWLKILNETEMKNKEAAIAQYKALFKDLWGYTIIDATKP